MYLYKCDVQCKDIDILYPPRKITISQMTFEIFPLNKSRREMTSDVLFGWPQTSIVTQITISVHQEYHILCLIYRRHAFNEINITEYLQLLIEIFIAFKKVSYLDNC